MVEIELGTVISGFVSGILGGAGAVKYQYRQKERHEAKTWYGKTERLAQRVILVDYDDWSGPKPVYARNTCAGVHSELARHLSDAPPSVDETIIGLSGELISKCQLLRMMTESEAEHASNEVKSRINPAVETAKQLKKTAKQARINVENSWI